MSDASGRLEVWVRDFPDGDRSIQVSVNGGTAPRWNAGGGELFYLERNKVVAVPVSTEPQFAFGKARDLFEFHGIGESAWDVSPDGKKFLVVEPAGDPPAPAIRVVLNWFEEFRGRW